MGNPGRIDKRLLDRLREAQRRFRGLDEELSNPEVIQNVDRLRILGQERAGLEPVIRVADRLLGLLHEYNGVQELLAEADDPEMRSLAGDEIVSLVQQIETLEDQGRKLLAPSDPLDDHAAVVEIRAGTGGDEAGLFANDLFRMYQRAAEREGWTIELMTFSEGIPGSIKEVIFTVRGKGVYGRLRCESGVHRVQRVPETESQGRIHTSAATVAVLPEADEVDIEVDPKDLRIDVFRSSGPGGQSVNTTDSAVRITHLPTGLVVSCQDEKSQHKNKAKALRVLRSRLLDRRVAEQEAERSRKRRAQVGVGDRSAKIRTYNFPQGRVTDHRIKLTLYALDQVLDGDLSQLIEALQLAHREEKLRSDEA